jgi:single-strand DNA-binding protein
MTKFALIVAINDVTLLGRVGADPQKRGNLEHELVTFSLATHTNYKLGSGIIVNFM